MHRDSQINQPNHQSIHTRSSLEALKSSPIFFLTSSSMPSQNEYATWKPSRFWSCGQHGKEGGSPHG